MLKHRTEMCDKLAPAMIGALRANNYTSVVVDTTYMPCSWMVVNQLQVRRAHRPAHPRRCRTPS